MFECTIAHQPHWHISHLSAPHSRVNWLSSVYRQALQCKLRHHLWRPALRTAAEWQVLIALLHFWSSFPLAQLERKGRPASTTAPSSPVGGQDGTPGSWLSLTQLLLHSCPWACILVLSFTQNNIPQNSCTACYIFFRSLLQSPPRAPFPHPFCNAWSILPLNIPSPVALEHTVNYSTLLPSIKIYTPGLVP